MTVLPAPVIAADVDFMPDGCGTNHEHPGARRAPQCSTVTCSV
jgi:hypothetical protein